MHLTPAGLPLGIPGIGEEIDGAVQHAPHLSLHGQVTYSLILGDRKEKAPIPRGPFSLVVKQAELTDVPSVYALERYSEHTCS